MINERMVQVAWAAGLYEGEGTVYRRANGDGVKLRVSMADKEVVESFADVFGLKVYKRCHAKNNGKAQWEAATESKAKVIEITCEMKPFLSQRRQIQIEQAIDSSMLPDWKTA